jgi:hypothetical protein
MGVQPGKNNTDKCKPNNFPPWFNNPLWARAFWLSRFHDQTLWDILHSVGLLRASDQTIAKSCGWQEATLTVDQHLCSPRGLNSQSWQGRGYNPTPYTAWPPVSAGKLKKMEKFLLHLPLFRHRSDIDRLGIGGPVAHNLSSNIQSLSCYSKVNTPNLC